MSVTMPAATMAETPERIPGAAFRAAATLHLQRNPHLSRESLARDLRERLARCGIRYHLRTLKRQLSGAVATVPPEVSRVLRDMIAESGGADAITAIEQALVEAGLSGESAATTPTYIACERMLPLAQLWLYLHPERSKRALALRLREELERIGIRLNVDSLQSILAGKQRLVRREIQDALFALLRHAGVTSAADAEARIEAMSREIRGAQEGRAFESARKIHELAKAWKIEHKEPSSRRLALLLKQRLAERGIAIGLPHVQKLVDGRARRVRHAMARAIESILRGEASPAAIEAPVAKDGQPSGVELDLAWVKAAPIAELARKHVAENPGMTMRKLAIKLSREVEALGYATSPNTIQPILGGHKKKTRGFIYRALLHLDGAVPTRVPHEHVFGAPRGERSTEPPPSVDPPADSETSPRSHLAPKASSPEAAPRKPRPESLGASLSQSPFGAYRAAIQRYQALDRETELELARRYRREGDHAAANALVESHLQFVVRVASQYRGYGMQLADLVEEGNLGLLEAVRRFEPSRNLRFKTYAIYWIRAYVVDHLLREWSIVGGGTGPLVSRTFFRLRRERAKLEMQLGEGDASIDALLATRFQTTEDTIRSMSLRVAARDTSLDVRTHHDDGPTLLETLRDPSSDPEHLTASAERDAIVRGVVDRVWKALDSRERIIVEERLLSGDDEVSLADLGRRLGVSRERVRQLEARTKSKLRSAFEAIAREGGEAAEVPPPAMQPEPESESEVLCA
ncbi:sigma-70 family RNA polymerase sigma factor [Polyangium sp. 15x6]|uniref:sigma-70 family RNA polymerase sigma factor n=1 Tax=Polyangium sp. 15x6 TaxID=3042687 RepID=UPI00249C2F10|nr:sigma-70 family RNA polymerase sigma factor [Polyangium sp. 15x6]MDI3290883.1 sigma-70 family RNA polymerase sigma factor [Polyangium sp. 15x6]